MFNCYNCLKNKNRKCELSVPLEDACICNNFKYYEERIPDKRFRKQQRAIVNLNKALEACRVSGLSLTVRNDELHAYDNELLLRLDRIHNLKGPTAYAQALDLLFVTYRANMKIEKSGILFTPPERIEE